MILGNPCKSHLTGWESLNENLIAFCYNMNSIVWGSHKLIISNTVLQLLLVLWPSILALTGPNSKGGSGVCVCVGFDLVCLLMLLA